MRGRVPVPKGGLLNDVPAGEAKEYVIEDTFCICWRRNRGTRGACSLSQLHVQRYNANELNLVNRILSSDDRPNGGVHNFSD